MNTATVIGRAGQDAEIRYFESGKVKTTFSFSGASSFISKVPSGK